MKTCGTCGYGASQPAAAGQPEQLICHVNPPQYGGHVQGFAGEQINCQTVFVLPPVHPDRPGCRFWQIKAGGKKK